MIFILRFVLCAPGKVSLMEGYLHRKSREVETKQHFSRRVNEDKADRRTSRGTLPANQ